MALQRLELGAMPQPGAPEHNGSNGNGHSNGAVGEHASLITGSATGKLDTGNQVFPIVGSNFNGAGLRPDLLDGSEYRVGQARKQRIAAEEEERRRVAAWEEERRHVAEDVITRGRGALSALDAGFAAAGKIRYSAGQLEEHTRGKVAKLVTDERLSGPGGYEVVVAAADLAIETRDIADRVGPDLKNAKKTRRRDVRELSRLRRDERLGKADLDNPDRHEELLEAENRVLFEDRREPTKRIVYAARGARKRAGNYAASIGLDTPEKQERASVVAREAIPVRDYARDARQVFEVVSDQYPKVRGAVLSDMARAEHVLSGQASNGHIAAAINRR